MKLQDYLCDQGVGCSKLTIRGVAEWLEEQARLNRHDRYVAKRIVADGCDLAAAELRDQLSVWQ